MFSFLIFIMDIELITINLVFVTFDSEPFITFKIFYSFIVSDVYPYTSDFTGGKYEVKIPYGTINQVFIF